MLLVSSVDHLKELCYEKQEEFFIRLNFGARSSKSIEYYPDDNKFLIFNQIDDSEEFITEKQLKTDTNIYDAIQKKAFFMY